MSKETYFLTGILFLFLFSCSKKDRVIEPEAVPKMKAAFSLQKGCTDFLFDTIQHIDSIVRFKNRSDTGGLVTYQWHFGDGDSSTVLHPQHIYTTPGTYRIRLRTFHKGRPSDTAYGNIRIILGQREFKTDLPYATAVDADETGEGEVLALLMGRNAYGDETVFSLVRTDSALRKKWLKPFAGSGIRASSIKKINADEYIVAGNLTAGDADRFCLSKINSNGDVLWVKYVAGLTGRNNVAIPTSDGNLLTIGSIGIGNNARTVVVKCDAAGNELWRKVFSGTASAPAAFEANNIIEVNNAYIFASLVPGANGQQIRLIKLNRDGNFLQQSPAVPALSGSTVFEAGVAFAANVLMVYATNTQYAYFFDNSLSFSHYKKVAESSIFSGIAKNSKFFIAEGAQQYGYIRQLQTNGTADWRGLINNTIQLSCSSFLSGASRSCKKVVWLSSGDILALSDGRNSPQGFTGSSVYLERFTPTGGIR